MLYVLSSHLERLKQTMYYTMFWPLMKRMSFLWVPHVPADLQVRAVWDCLEPWSAWWLWVLLPMTTMPLDPVPTRYCLDINQYHILCSLFKISLSPFLSDLLVLGTGMAQCRNKSFKVQIQTKRLPFQIHVCLTFASRHKNKRVSEHYTHWISGIKGLNLSDCTFCYFSVTGKNFRQEDLNFSTTIFHMWRAHAKLYLDESPKAQ